MPGRTTASVGSKIWTVKAWVNAPLLDTAPANLDRWARELVSGTCGMMQAEARANLARNGSVKTGNLWRKIQIVGDGLRMAVEALAFYAGYVEWGTRHMTARPYFTPAAEQARRWFNEQARTLPSALLGSGTGLRRVKILIPRTSRGGPL